MNKKKTQKVLVIVAHSDDETLGLGGTIANHSVNGDEVYVLSMTDGVSARINCKNSDIEKRMKASRNVSNILGFNWLEPASFPDNAMDSVPLLDVIRVIEIAKKKVNPTIIYTHSSADLNIDHRIVSSASLTAFRPHASEIWNEILLFEVPSATDYAHKSVTNSFQPNSYVNITSSWKKKLAALKEYNIEMRNPPNSRSFEGLENLAKFRGNQVGLHYAEAFELIRRIRR